MCPIERSQAASAVISDRGEARAAKWIQALGHRVEKIPEVDSKTPDFRFLTVDGIQVALAEIKLIEGPGQGEDLLWSAVFNNISKRIHDARKQFESIDSSHVLPRVLVFVSEDFRVHGQTMLDFFTGHIEVGGKVIRELKTYRLGRVKADIGEIDLYVILDHGDTPTLFFNDSNDEYAARLEELFLGHA
jgi:hypothetical protein